MMKRHRGSNSSHMISELFTFALFGMFLLLSLLIVVIGVDGYRNVVNAGDTAGEIRTSLGYVSGKVRSEASGTGVRIDTINGVDALVLTNVYNDTPYDTVIFHKEGALYEDYFNASEMEFDPDFGERLVELTGFDVSWAADNLLAVTATAADGRTETLHLALRSGQEVANR